MRSVFTVSLLLVLALVLSTVASKTKHKQNKGRKQEKMASECTGAETHYGRCVPQSGDCGGGLREVTCKEHTEKIRCKIPCNWKKDIVDCKYKFGHWSECDTATNTKTRTGALKQVKFNAECQATFKVTKPCGPTSKKRKGMKGN